MFLGQCKFKSRCVSRVLKSSLERNEKCLLSLTRPHTQIASWDSSLGENYATFKEIKAVFVLF